jgi:gamma-glutamyltranspeptidase/glutathione hydrolase
MMLETAFGFNGAFTAPHGAAAMTGRDVLNAGGSAVEAMVAAAATIAVAYPHMNGLGGDAFWIIHRPGSTPIAISGAGRAAALATPEHYAAQGMTGIPARGPDAALVVPGAVATWQNALALENTSHFTLAELLADAIALARDGVAVTPLLAHTSAAKAAELAPIAGFAEVHQPGGRPLATGDRFVQAGLASTLERLASAGLDDFYRGDIAATHSRFLEAAGSPLRLSDFHAYSAISEAPLAVTTSAGTIYNIPPPTQGIATLIALALFDRMAVTQADGFAHLHLMLEATKRAYSLRNRYLADPDTMTVDVRTWLTDAFLAPLAASIDPAVATPWPEPSSPGDTIWMGAADKNGTVVSFIQSLYWEYGSGLTCPQTGITFENRGAGFSLRPGPNQLAPGKRPFHTLNPGLAELEDGRVLSFGTQGGEGQPQTMTALFSRYVQFGQGLQRAITAPRWLLGTTWADPTTTLKLESRFPPELVAALRAAGHVTEVVSEFDPMMGNAGAVVYHPNGLMEAATDPRSDGAALAF